MIPNISDQVNGFCIDVKLLNSNRKAYNIIKKVRWK